MMKRIISFILVTTLLFACAGTALAEEPAEDAVAITAPEELRLLENDPDGSYYLDADLDMSGIDWTPIAFRGKLDGRGHSIFNLTVTSVGADHADTVDGNSKVYDSVFAGLFSTLIDAEVKDLTLQGVDIDVESDRHCFVGGIAGFIRGAEITGCSVLDARMTLTAAIKPDATQRKSCNAGVGGIAGFGSGVIIGCRADLTLVFSDHCDSFLKCEEFMGGILACGNALISDCTVTIRGFDECRGYAHNGGLVGMFFAYNKNENPRPISGCYVSGSITFYEDNYDRRAYCQPFVGEMLTWTNTSDNAADFLPNELFDYTAVLRPEQCTEPDITDNVHEPSCTEAGYTEHVCSVCGNTWRDSFVPVTHVPGEWVVTQDATYEESGVKSLMCALCGQVIRQEVIPPHVDGEWVVTVEPGYGTEGMEQLLCADCGCVLQERPIPARVAVSRIDMEPSSMELSYRQSGELHWTLIPDDPESTIVYFSSSDERVATVDTDGTVHAVGKGEAVITCTSADGFAHAECAVTVNRTLWQWIRQYILFGWVIKH